MSQRYTKVDLEKIVYKQIENLNAMHDLLGIMKFQNDLIQNINQTLREEIGQFKRATSYVSNKKKVKIVIQKKGEKLSSFSFEDQIVR